MRQKRVGDSAITVRGLVETLYFAKDGFVAGVLRATDNSFVKFVGKAARKMNTPKDNPGRIRAGIQYCVAEALNDGSCWVEYEDLLNRANQLLVMDDLDSRDIIEHRLKDLLGEGQLVSSSFEVQVVANPEIEQMERELVHRADSSL